jgi:cell division protein FtsN
MADSRRPQRPPSRVGSILAGVGCLGVLGLTFGAGFYSGRYWTRASAADLPPSASSITASATPGRHGASTASSTALTFYEELTAPLPVSPPPAKVTATEARRAADRFESPAPRPDERAAKSESRADAPLARRSEPTGVGTRFTVQIAAYSARASAEALRNTVSAAGHEAYIVESDGPPGAPRFRVRVGSYATREAAIAAASRLPVPGARYVTTR